MSADASYNQFAGRPDWNRIGRELATAHPGKEVGVFLTGPAAIETQLRAMCDKFNKGDDGATFVFHKETF